MKIPITITLPTQLNLDISRWKCRLNSEYRNKVKRCKKEVLKRILKQKSNNYLFYTESEPPAGVKSVFEYVYTVADAAVDYGDLLDWLYYGGWSIFTMEYNLSENQIFELNRLGTFEDLSSLEDVIYLESWHDDYNWKLIGDEKFIRLVNDQLSIIWSIDKQ